MGLPKSVQEIMGERADKLVQEWTANFAPDATVTLSAMIAQALVRAREEVTREHRNPWDIVIDDLRANRELINRAIQTIEQMQATRRVEAEVLG
jgi:hypothetical protein